MQSLMNGADCSASSNPLNSMLKRAEVDNSVFRVSRMSLRGSRSKRARYRAIS
jgi:hypothetical protein